MNKILIINTGGTISSVPSKKGFIPAPHYLEKAFAKFYELQHPSLPQYVIHEFDPLIDSSNMTVAHWNQLVEIISRHPNMDGFIIFHGTDTMAYTASALSFMLRHLGKPVILTGSQLPLSAARNDAIENIIASLILASQYPIYEVCICFNQKLLRGNRTKKFENQSIDAFNSPLYPPLAELGLEIQFYKDRLLPKPQKPLEIQLLHPKPIAHFRLFPGFSITLLEALLNTQPQALILETYGTGNAPDDPAFLALLKKAVESGITLVNISQCPIGKVESHYYETGQALEKIGIISAEDMTIEAIYCKLLYALNQTDNPKEINHIMRTTLCGEKT